MISCLGFYLTRSGQTVHITKIYQSQPVAEGWLFDGFIKTHCHIWKTSGEFSNKGEHKHDIIRFMYFSDPNENSYD